MAKQTDLFREIRFSNFYFLFTFEQEQLRRRREEEDRIAQQNEFLRASLRGSRKLQALQEQDSRPPIGVENDAFVADEEGERIVGECVCVCVHLNWSENWMKIASIFDIMNKHLSATVNEHWKEIRCFQFNW